VQAQLLFIQQITLNERIANGSLRRWAHLQPCRQRIGAEVNSTSFWRRRLVEMLVPKTSTADPSSLLTSVLLPNIQMREGQQAVHVQKDKGPCTLRPTCPLDTSEVARRCGLVESKSYFGKCSC